jgi:hypothetical protein
LIFHDWQERSFSFGVFIYENPVLVATPTAFFREAWAFGCQEKCPRFAATAVANPLTVATSAIFICGGELEKVMAHFHENTSLEGGRRAPSRRPPTSNGSPL